MNLFKCEPEGLTQQAYQVSLPVYRVHEAAAQKGFTSYLHISALVRFLGIYQEFEPRYVLMFDGELQPKGMELETQLPAEDRNPGLLRTSFQHTHTSNTFYSVEGQTMA